MRTILQTSSNLVVFDFICAVIALQDEVHPVGPHCIEWSLNFELWRLRSNIYGSVIWFRTWGEHLCQLHIDWFQPQLNLCKFMFHWVRYRSFCCNPGTWPATRFDTHPSAICYHSNLCFHASRSHFDWCVWTSLLKTVNMTYDFLQLCPNRIHHPGSSVCGHYAEAESLLD